MSNQHAAAGLRHSRAPLCSCYVSTRCLVRFLPVDQKLNIFRQLGSDLGHDVAFKQCHKRPAIRSAGVKPRAATRIDWPVERFGRSSANRSGLITTAISRVNVTVSKPARFMANQRKPKPVPSTQVAKNSAAGLVFAMVISTAKS